MVKLLLPIFKYIINKISNNLFGVIKSRWMISIFIFISLFVGTVYTANNFYVYQMKKNYINLSEMKKVITSYIKTQLNKAIELGIVDFSLLEGITIEDIKISEEEDFSNNKLFFLSQRVDIKLSSVLSKNVFIEEIVVHNSKLEIDVNEFNIETFFKYFKERNFPKIEFRNLNFTLKDGSKELIKSEKPIQLTIQKINNEIMITFDDSYFNLPFTMNLFGTGNIDQNNRFTIDVRFNKFPINNLQGFIKSVLGSVGDKGETEGFVRVSKLNEEVNLEGDINLINYSGTAGIVPGFEFNEISLNTKFSYFKEVDENKKFEVYYKRKISNPNFLFSDSVVTNKSNLRKIQINSRVEDFSKLSNELILNKNDKYKGKMNLSLEVEETGKGTDWFVGEGKISVENFELKMNENKMDLEISTADFEFDTKNMLISKIEGKLFNSPFVLNGKTNLNFSKILNQKYNYQIINNSNIEVLIDNFFINDFKPIYESIYLGIQDDIKERQEKMLPDSYIVESNFYKTYLDKLNLVFTLKTNSISKSKESEPIGKIDLITKFSKANLELEMYDMINTTKGKKQVNFKAILDRKNPYYDLKVKVEDLNWGDKFYNICGTDFLSKNFDIMISFVALGNNFSDIIINKSFNIDFFFKNVSYKQNEFIDNLNLNEILNKDKTFDIKGNLSGYGQESNFRSIEISGIDTNYKGYTTSNFSRGSGYQFSLYGVHNNKNTTYNFFEVNNRCQLKK
jgi:hypothetical protein